LSENPWAQQSIIALGISAILSVLCAIGAFKTYYSRFRRSNVAKAKMLGYTLIAISLGGFSITTRMAEHLPTSDRQFISFLGIVVLALGLAALLYSLWEFHRFMRQRDG